MCNWGDGCLGKKVNYVGQYAQEVYFYCDDDNLKEKIIELLDFDKVRKYANSISSKRISVMKLYKYFYENIEGVTLKKDKKQLSLF